MSFPSDIQEASYWGIPYNNLSTTLSQEASASDTTIYVALTTNFDAIGEVTCEDEIIYHTGKTAGSFTGCTRGYGNTTAAIHASGKQVSLTFTATMWERIVADHRAAITKIGADSSDVTSSIDYLVKNTNPNAVAYSHANGIKLDKITERTADAGVTIDGLLIKDEAIPNLPALLSGLIVSNWQLRTSAADNSWLSVCWSKELSLFCAVANTGTGNRVMTSLFAKI